MSAEAILNQVVSAVRAGKTNKIDELARQFDREATAGEEYTESYFDVMLKIFSDREIQKSKEIFAFLVYLGPSSEQLSSNQFDRLAEVIEANIENFGDEMLVHTAVDFICRYYEPNDVLRLLNSLANKNIPSKGKFLRMGVNTAVLNNKMHKDAAIEWLRKMGLYDDPGI